MKKHVKNLHQKVRQEVQQKTDWKNLSPRDKRNTIIALCVIIFLIIGLLYILIVGSDFVYREEQQMDKITNYIFIPLFIIVILASIFSGSISNIIAALLVCGIFIYPAMEDIVMFLNVKIGDQKEKMISGTVIEKKMTGNKHMTKHYKVKTDNGEVYTFTYEGHITSYEVNDQFRHQMKRGYFGILYKEFKN
jgi:hypothetical protein